MIKTQSLTLMHLCLSLMSLPGEGRECCAGDLLLPFQASAHRRGAVVGGIADNVCTHPSPGTVCLSPALLLCCPEKGSGWPWENL